METQSEPRAWVEVDVEAIAHNLGVARRVAGDAQMMPVVKANAYGHGLETVARRLDSEGIAFLEWQMQEKLGDLRRRRCARSPSYSALLPRRRGRKYCCAPGAARSLLLQKLSILNNWRRCMTAG